MQVRVSATIAAAFALALSGPALAQRSSDRFDLTPGERQVERDVQGRIRETRERESTGTIVRRDAQGRRLGTVERGTGGRLIERDAQGRRTGTIERR